MLVAMRAHSSCARTPRPRVQGEPTARLGGSRSSPPAVGRGIGKSYVRVARVVGASLSPAHLVRAPRTVYIAESPVARSSRSSPLAVLSGEIKKVHRSFVDVCRCAARRPRVPPAAWARVSAFPTRTPRQCSVTSSRQKPPLKPLEGVRELLLQSISQTDGQGQFDHDRLAVLLRQCEVRRQLVDGVDQFIDEPSYLTERLVRKLRRERVDLFPLFRR